MPALSLLLGVQLVLALTLPVAAPFSVDEVAYQEMTRSFVEGHGFFVDNGYEEVASPELTTAFITGTSEGRLAAQYPYGLPMLASGLYAMLGARGIVLANAVAFVAIVALTYVIAERLLGNKWVATMSVALLAASTFVWEYSLAIWPHATALALGLGAVTTMLVAAEGTKGRSSAYAALSGLLFGLAVLNRLDAVLLLPAIAACLIGRENQQRIAMGFVAGVLPPAAILSLSNWVRWGTLLPFSYGGGISDWIMPIIGTGLSLVVGVAVLIFFVRRRGPASKRTITLVWSAVLLVVVAIPTTRRFLASMLGGIWTLVVDLRSYRLTEEAALDRLADGALIYHGTVKKALLQSAPYLMVAAIPIISAWRTAQRRAVLILVAPIVVYLGFFAPRAWHGGLSFNLRYFLPLLPFAVILAAWAFRLVIDRIGSDVDVGRSARISIIATLFLFAVGRLSLPSLEATGWFLSLTPLFIAAATLLAMTALLIWSSRQLARATLVLAVAGATWATAVSYGYDAASTLEIRGSHLATSTAIASVIEDGSLLLVDWPDDTFGVKELLEDVVIAQPSQDQYQTFDAILSRFTATRAVFGAMPAEAWAELPDPHIGSWVEIGQVGSYSIRLLQGTPLIHQPTAPQYEVLG